MVFQQLVASNYAKDLTEAAATNLVSCESVHRDKGESAMAAIIDAIDNGGLFDFEQALTLLVGQAVNIHEDQRDHPPFEDPASLADWLPTGQDEEDRLLTLFDPEPRALADWLPTGQDEEDRILSLISAGPF